MRTIIAVSVALVLLLPAIAPAQQKGSIVLTTVSEVDVTQKNAEGKKEVKRIEAAKANVVPGDTVIFTIAYENRDTKPADRVVVINPVPEHMTYVDKSAEGTGTAIDFSIDGGRTYAQPGKLRVTEKGVQRSARPAEYTHIRWVLAKPLPPGGKGTVSFKARLK